MCKRLILLTFVLLLSVATNTVLSDLVAYYPMDEGAGNIVHDVSGNGHDGAREGGITWVPGFTGSAINVPGTAWSRVHLGAWNPAEGTGQLGISMWINWAGQSGNSHDGLIGKRDAWNVDGLYFFTEINGDDIDIRNRNTTVGSPGGEVPVGEWAHIAYSFDGTTVRVYLDGVELASGAFAFDNKANAYMAIGCTNGTGGTSEVFNGEIDEVRLYNHALTAAEIQTLAEKPMASDPSPADEAVLDSTTATMFWTAGANATSRNVYLGESYDDVLDGLGDTLVAANSTDTWYLAQNLVPGATYYWRVEEIQPDSSKHPGFVWSFSVPDFAAYDFQPADGAADVAMDDDLSWSEGLEAILYNVYLSTDFDAVKNGTVAPQVVPSPPYSPVGLAPSTTYYWRVDTTSPTDTYEGPVWSFTTLPPPPTAIPVHPDPTLVGWWTFDYGGGGTAYDWSGNGNDGEVRGGPKWVEGIHGRALDCDGVDDFVFTGKSASSLGIEGAKPKTATAWVYTRLWNDGGGIWDVGNRSAGEDWCLRVRGGANQWRAQHWSDPDHDFTYPSDHVWVHFAMVYDGTASIVYANGAEVSREDSTLATADNNPFQLARYGYPEDYFGGIIDDVRLYTRALTPAEIVEVMQRVNPYAAWSPGPADGGFSNAALINWSPGDGAARHIVYFGTDPDAVAGADTSSPECRTAPNGQTPTSFSVAGLVQPGNTYYWRIDEVKADSTVTEGYVWSFVAVVDVPTGELFVERYLTPNLTIAERIAEIDAGVAPDETEVITNGFAVDPDIDQYGSRIFGWVYAPATGDYRFNLTSDDNGRLYLGTDDDPSSKVEIARETGSRGLNSFPLGGEERSDPIPLVAGERYYIEAIYDENGGGDHCQVAWTGPGIGDSPTVIASKYVAQFDPLQAHSAAPVNGAVAVRPDVVLTWMPGKFADSHNVYVGSSEAAVAAATPASPEFRGTLQLGTEEFDTASLGLGLETTYYWRIDEMSAANPDYVGKVWSFTTGNFFVIDDFESYTNLPGERIWEFWIDGVTDPGLGGSQVGHNPTQQELDAGTGSFAELNFVHSGSQSMPVYYDNYSRVKLPLVGTQRDWTRSDVVALSMWYQGRSGRLGDVVEGPSGVYTVTGAGRDIWNLTRAGDFYGWHHDEFHYAYKTLGPGTVEIIAKVSAITADDLDAMNSWTKAGVMIRESLDPNSPHAFMCLTNTQGVSFQRRPVAGEDSASSTTGGVSQRPLWLRLTKDIAGNYTGFYADDVGGNPGTWTEVGTENFPMNPGYIGLAVTSHTGGVTATATFSDITATGAIPAGSWATNHEDIGYYNDVKPMSITIEDGAGQTATVPNPDPDASVTVGWAELGDGGIVLSEFTAANPAVNLGDVNSISIRFSDASDPPAGLALEDKSLVLLDDIRLYVPRCVPAKGQPAGDFNNDCKTDLADVELVINNWLVGDIVYSSVEEIDGLVVHYMMDEESGNVLVDSSGNGNDAVIISGSEGQLQGVVGKSGWGLGFGPDDHGWVEMPAHVVTSARGTVAVWIDTSQGDADNNDEGMIWYAAASGGDGFGGEPEAHLHIDDGGNGALEFQMEDGGNGDKNLDTNNQFGPLEGWQHAAVTWDIDQNVIRLYVDGVLEETEAHSGMDVIFTQMKLGRPERTGGGNRYYEGLMDELRIYDRALAGGEVALIAGLPGPITDPIESQLIPNNPAIDINGDRVINFLDFAIIGDTWLDEILWP